MSINDGINEYLKPTMLCDFDNAKVREKARDIIGYIRNSQRMKRF